MTREFTGFYAHEVGSSDAASLQLLNIKIKNIYEVVLRACPLEVEDKAGQF